MYHKRGIWAIKAKHGGVFPRHDPSPKPDAPAQKPPKFYPADDVRKPLVNKHKPKPAKLRYFLPHSYVCIWCFDLFGMMMFYLSGVLLLLENVEQKKGF